MVDLYLRPEEENTDILESYEPIEIFVQQLEVLFFTQPGDVLGSPRMGIDLERYIHELFLNEYDLKQKINIQIKQYCPLALQFSYDIGIYFAKASDGRDAVLINVTIENETILGIVL